MRMIEHSSLDAANIAPLCFIISIVAMQYQKKLIISMLLCELLTLSQQGTQQIENLNY